ncbi:hypothetical protein [Microcoleus sp. FACHB-68]|uniref:hypothetical protein n=1 Tax=Microcoleus sp. FACHB-68 TaxID=2692826 RepID=UPI0016854346|nr:hypothetical protein [Microcoleus sp. FACHB-68]MBD1940547.1 hypothetical protein [Microcoleus sp. FACHB-68]
MSNLANPTHCSIQKCSRLSDSPQILRELPAGPANSLIECAGSQLSQHTLAAGRNCPLS